MRMGTLPTLGTSRLGAWAARNAVIGLGLSLFAVLCAACYKTADLNGSDRNGKDASLLDDARQPHDTYPDTNETNHDTTESQDAPDDDTAELASDDGEPLPPSFCSGRDSGETEKMAELIYPGNSIAVDDKSVYIAGEYEDYMGGTIWRIDKADGEKHALVPPDDKDWRLFRRHGVLALDDTYMYAGDSEGNLARIPKSGGDLEIYELSAGEITKIIVENGRFFIRVLIRSPVFNTTLWHGMTDTFPQMEVLVEEIDAFDVQEEMVCYVQGNTLWRQPIAGGERIALWEKIVDLEYALLLVANEGIYLYDNRGIVRVDTAGGSAEPLWQGIGGSDWFGFTVDGDDAYWTLETGELWHGSVSSQSEPWVMAQHGPYDSDNLDPTVAVDDDTIYWTAAPDDPSRTFDDENSFLYRTCR